MAVRQAGATGLASEGTSAANAVRTAGGAVGARSFPQTVLTFADRNERSSRKKSSRCLPHLNVR